MWFPMPAVLAPRVLTIQVVNGGIAVAASFHKITLNVTTLVFLSKEDLLIMAGWCHVCGHINLSNLFSCGRTDVKRLVQVCR